MKSRLLCVYAFAYLAFLYVPVLVLPIFSFNNSQFIAFPLTGFTTRWYGALASDSAMQHALGNSLKVGIVTALLSTLLGLAAARAVTRYCLRGAGAALAFISLPLFIPDIVLGISLLLLLGTGFLGSFSTFSTFMAEVFAVLRERAWGETLGLLASSVLGGLLAMELGLAIGQRPDRMCVPDLFEE